MRVGGLQEHPTTSNASSFADTKVFTAARGQLGKRGYTRLRNMHVYCNSDTEAMHYQDAQVDISLSVQTMSQKALLRSIPRESLTMSSTKLREMTLTQERSTTRLLFNDTEQLRSSSCQQAVRQLRGCSSFEQLQGLLPQTASMLDAGGICFAAALLSRYLYDDPLQVDHAMRLQNSSGSGSGGGDSNGVSVQEQEDTDLLEQRRSSNSVASSSGPPLQGQAPRLARQEAARHLASIIASRAKVLLPRINARKASTIVYALAKAGHQGDGLVPMLLVRPEQQQQLALLTAAELFRLIWGLAALGANPSETWLQEFCKVSQSHFPTCSPAQMSMFAWALVRLRHQPSDYWLHALLDVSESQLQAFPSQSLCSLVWALGRLDAEPSDSWVSHCLQAAERQLHPGSDLKSCGVGMLLYGMVLLHWQPPTSLLDACLAGTPARLPHHTPLDDCNLIWALAVWGHQPQASFMHTFSSSVAARLHQYTPTDLSVMAWALSHLSYLPPGPWMQHYLARSLDALPAYSPADITSTFLSLSRWGLQADPRYTHALLAHTKRKLPAFSARCLVALLWGLVQLRQRVPPTWLSLPLHHLQPHLQHLDAEGCGTVLYAVACLTPDDPAKRAKFIADNKAAVWRLVQRSHELVYQAGPQELYAGLMGLARLRVNPGRKYLRAHLRAAQQCGAGFVTQQVAAMRAAYRLVQKQPLLKPQVERLR